MGKYTEYSGVRVVLEDILEELDELRDSKISQVLRTDGDSTDQAIRQLIGEVAGLERAILRLRSTFGAGPINEEMTDTRY